MLCAGSQATGSRDLFSHNICVMYTWYSILISSPDTIVGVNKHTLDHEEAVEVLSIDNAKTIEIQVRIEDSLHMHTFTHNCVDRR